MFKSGKAQYSIKSCPCDDTEQLEQLLNSMAENGWELYSMHEAENGDEYQFNCIFVKDSDEEDDEDDSLDFLGFKSKMERIMNPILEPVDLCVDIQKKIKEKRQRISQIKSLLDSTSEDSRATLNEDMSVTLKELSVLKHQLMEVLSPDIMQSKLGEHKFSMSLSEELLDLINPDSDDNLIAQVVQVRQDLTENVGYIIPKVMFNEDDSLQANEFTLNVRGLPVLKSAAYPGCTMYFKDELHLSKLPKNAVKDIDFVTGKPIVWIENSKTNDFWADGLDIREFISRAIKFAIIKFIDDIFDYADVNRYIEIVGTQNLYLVENVIPDYLSVAELKYILASLVKEKVSIKDIIYIFEKINDFSDESSKEDLLARIRISLARQISMSLLNKDLAIQAISLSDKSISYLAKSIGDSEVVRLDSNKIEKLAKNIMNTVHKNELDDTNIILIAPRDIRHVMFLVLAQFIPNIKVVAREELLFEYPLEVVAEV